MAKILGVALYQGAKKKEFYEEDLKHPDSLCHFLGELYDSESDITEDGITFLKEYYGMEKVVDLLKERDFGGELLRKFMTKSFTNSKISRQKLKRYYTNTQKPTVTTISLRLLCFLSRTEHLRYLKVLNHMKKASLSASYFRTAC